MPKEASPSFIRTVIPIPVSAAELAGTGAMTLLDAFVPGYKFSVEAVKFITRVTLVGAGGTQTFEVRKGGTTGTILATVTPVIANQATIGQHATGLVGAANENAAYVGSDTGTISITRAAGGTAFSAGEGILLVVLRQRLQARR